MAITIEVQCDRCGVDLDTATVMAQRCIKGNIWRCVCCLAAKVNSMSDEVMDLNDRLSQAEKNASFWERSSEFWKKAARTSVALPRS